jgi:hypothetical protein
MQMNLHDGNGPNPDDPRKSPKPPNKSQVQGNQELATVSTLNEVADMREHTRVRVTLN